MTWISCVQGIVLYLTMSPPDSSLIARKSVCNRNAAAHKLRAIVITVLGACTRSRMMHDTSLWLLMLWWCCVVQNTLSEQREVYRPLAARGASIFFVMTDLQTLNTMYHFSLAMFLSLFAKVRLPKLLIVSSIPVRSECSLYAPQPSMTGIWTSCKQWLIAACS